MNNDNATYQLIKDYLKGNLTDSEVISFNKRLESDNEFREIFETEKAIYNALKFNELDGVKGKVESLKRISNIRRNIRLSILFGLIIAVLATLFFVVLYNNSPKAKGKHVTSSRVNFFKTKSDKQANSNVITPDQTKELNYVDEMEEPNNNSDLTQKDTSINEFKNDTINRPLVDLKDSLSYPSEKEVSNTDSVAVNAFKADSIIPKEQKIPCTLTLSHKDIKVEESCKEYSSGKISFEKGEMFSINNGVTYTPKDQFKNLQYGEYVLKIKDQEGCESNELVVDINNYPCNAIVSNSQYQYWTPNLSMFNSSQEIEVVIYHGRSKILVYSKKIEPSVPFTWNGINNNGSQLGKGNYIYFITNSKTGKQVKGQITIVD